MRRFKMLSFKHCGDIFDFESISAFGHDEFIGLILKLFELRKIRECLVIAKFIIVGQFETTRVLQEFLLVSDRYFDVGESIHLERIIPFFLKFLEFCGFIEFQLFISLMDFSG